MFLLSVSFQKFQSLLNIQVVLRGTKPLFLSLFVFKELSFKMDELDIPGPRKNGLGGGYVLSYFMLQFFEADDWEKPTLSFRGPRNRSFLREGTWRLRSEDQHILRWAINHIKCCSKPWCLPIPYTVWLLSSTELCPLLVKQLDSMSLFKCFKSLGSFRVKAWKDCPQYVLFRSLYVIWPKENGVYRGFSMHVWE